MVGPNSDVKMEYIPKRKSRHHPLTDHLVIGSTQGTPPPPPPRHPMEEAVPGTEEPSAQWAVPSLPGEHMLRAIVQLLLPPLHSPSLPLDLPLSADSQIWLAFSWGFKTRSAWPLPSGWKLAPGSRKPLEAGRLMSARRPAP